jgi:hypothetical protein
MFRWSAEDRNQPSEHYIMAEKAKSTKAPIANPAKAAAPVAKPLAAPATQQATVVRNATVAKPAKAAALPVISKEERWNLVARAAYFRAEKRAFAAGHDLSDWMEAEREVDAAHTTR